MRILESSRFSTKRLYQNLQAGFTLMEMLIVIGIIGLLSTLGVFSYNTAQRNARDVQRLSDLSAMQKGMESYYAENGVYTCSENLLIQSGALPDGFPVDPKTQIDMEFLTLLQERLAKPFANRSLIPQAYAQGTCSYCVNTQTHINNCIAAGGSTRFELSCNSTQCCVLGAGGASPTPSPGSGGGGGGTGGGGDDTGGGGTGGGGTGGGGTGGGGTGGGSSSGAQSDEHKYTLSSCTSSTYCACTRLERDGTGNASDRNCTWQAEGDFYCVQQTL